MKIQSKDGIYSLSLVSAKYYQSYRRLSRHKKIHPNARYDKFTLDLDTDDSDNCMALLCTEQPNLLRIDKCDDKYK